MFNCQVEGCNYIGLHITNNHYQSEHGMTRQEVVEKYGEAKFNHNRRQKQKREFIPSLNIEKEHRKSLMRKLNG